VGAYEINLISSIAYPPTNYKKIGGIKLKSKSQKIQELIGLAMKVQHETNYCVFVRFAGHVSSFEIDIRESKKSYNDEVVSGEFYTDGRYGEERFEKNYRKMRNALLEILETGEFNPNSENVRTVERVEYDYKFNLEEETV
jgi:hypothetical protein